MQAPDIAHDTRARKLKRGNKAPVLQAPYEPPAWLYSAKREWANSAQRPGCNDFLRYRSFGSGC